jgi:hypothetical protein
VPSIINNYKVEEDEVGETDGTNGGEEESTGRKARGKTLRWTFYRLGTGLVWFRISTGGVHL